MTDEQIITLYNARNQRAIEETDRSYGRYFRYIAYGILQDEGDSSEVVNDSYMKTWEVIPPEKPRSLRAFVGTITRKFSINRLKRKMAIKRGGGAVEVALEELSECVGEESEGLRDDVFGLSEALNSFLSSLTVENRRFFVKRYWHMHSIFRIARESGVSESKVKSSLMRTREKLRNFLKKEGFSI